MYKKIILTGLLLAIASTAGAQSTSTSDQARSEWLTGMRKEMRNDRAGDIYRSDEMVGMFEPRFPLEQLLHGEGGEVKLRVRLNEAREVVGVVVTGSSGNKILDAVAEKTVRQWMFYLHPKKYTAGEHSVPIVFSSIAGKEPTSYDGVQLIPLLTYNDRSKKHKNKITAEPGFNELRTINEARQYLEKACNKELWEKDENIVVYNEFGNSGLNVWSFFEPEGRFGPSVVRRTITSMRGRLYVTTSYICEAGQESCKLFREYLDAGFSSSSYKMPGIFEVPKKLKKCK